MSFFRYIVDKITNAIVTIGYAHHEIHDGSHYIFRSYETVAKNGNKEILIVTPNTTKWGHVTIGFFLSTSTTLIELFEGVTTSANGTLANSRNRNRNFTDNNTVLLYDDPTVTDGAVAGNVIQDGMFGSGKNSFGGGARDNEEVVLKQNTKYLFRATEQNVSAVIFNYYFDWYEHTDKN